MTVHAQTEDKDGVVRTTRIDEPEEAFTAIIKRADLAMNFLYGSSKVDDGEGNEIQVYLWVSGDWHITYKGKEYIIPIDENITALINWINAQ